MKLEIIVYKFIVLIEGVVGRSVEFIVINSKKLFIRTDPLVRKFCSYFVQNSEK